MLVILVVGGYLVWSRRQANRAIALHEAQDLIDRRALDLLGEFPQASDEEIATLISDELTNKRVESREMYELASVATVARIRRTAILAHVRSEKKKAMKASKGKRRAASEEDDEVGDD